VRITSDFKTGRSAWGRDSGVGGVGGFRRTMRGRRQDLCVVVIMARGRLNVRRRGAALQGLFYEVKKPQHRGGREEISCHRGRDHQKNLTTNPR